MDHESTVKTRLPDPGAAWWLVGLVVLGVLVWVGLSYLGWLVFGLFTYYVARPIARRVQSRVGSPSLAAGLTLAFIIGPIVLFLAAFLSIAVGQALELLSGQTAQDVLARLPIPTQNLPTDPVQIVAVVLQDPTVSTALGEFGVAVGAVGATLFNAFLALIFAFFLLTSDDALAAWFERNVFGADSLAADYLHRVDGGLTSIYFGYTLTIFVVIVFAAVIYTAFNAVAPGGLRIPQAVLLAVITGVFTLIPLLGRSIIYAFIVALLSVQAVAVDTALLWVPVAFFVLMVLVFDNVIRTYVRPYLSGKAYHMALVMFAYLLGPALFGWYGIFLGPLVMVVTVEFITEVLPRLAGVAPDATDGTDADDTAEPPVEETDPADRGGEAPSD